MGYQYFKGRLVAFLFFFLSFTHLVNAETIANISTLDGHQYEVNQFGSFEKSREYYVKIGHQFVPLLDTQSIARVNTSGQRASYLVVLKNGEITSGRIGVFFYEKVTYQDPQTNEVKQGYSAVLRGRDQQGLTFTSANTRETIEIPYPNEIDKIVFHTHFADANAEPFYYKTKTPIIKDPAIN